MKNKTPIWVKWEKKHINHAQNLARDLTRLLRTAPDGVEDSRGWFEELYDELKKWKVVFLANGAAHVRFDSDAYGLRRSEP